MKKLFTLLFAVGTMSSVFAQYNNDNKYSRPGRDESTSGYESGKGNGTYSAPDRKTENRDYAYNDDRRYKESVHSSRREMEFQVQKINREFDFKIRSVAANRYMRLGEKNRQIRNLENQRNKEIKILYARYNDNSSRHTDPHPNRW